MRPSTLLLFLLLPFLGRSASASEPDALRGSTQMIVVTTTGWDAVEGRLQRYERSGAQGEWKPLGDSFAVVLGKNGMAWGAGLVPTGDSSLRESSDPVKKEGDGRAPAGAFALGQSFGASEQPLPGSKLPYLSLTPTVECVDDSASKSYNRLVDRAAVAPDWNSSEKMLSTGELYRWGIVVGHNNALSEKSPSRQGGSCIFLHVWRDSKQGTAGCTAMPRQRIEEVLLWIDPEKKPVLVQLPVEKYALLIDKWNLPKVTNIGTK